MFDADALINPPAASELIATLQSESSKDCIKRLVAHFSENRELKYSLSSEPQRRLAAVLVLLYEHDGELRVLLTTRSKELRTHAGQTALPGGKADAEDIDFVHTARREASEEVALPQDSPHIHVLGRLDPAVSLHRLIVVPIIAFLSKPELLKSLKASEGEVAKIFSHPLEAILDPSISLKEPLSAIGSEDWPYEDTEVYNTSDHIVEALGNSIYRMHRFRTSASPVKGLTADILTKTAEIAYGKPTVYSRYAPNQPTDYGSIINALDSLQNKNTPLNGLTSNSARS
ncbi:NUDIX hydrolase [Ephemerocybe angulata]|uniref:NUDIX hydrolase n=1 Tax=Ephemerocybe angulata TaxID=980116 RepID=A0A8H6M7W4_9AGAR|nr:NUDIX hydrolase [Tulosesus angulatus]